MHLNVHEHTCKPFDSKRPRRFSGEKPKTTATATATAASNKDFNSNFSAVKFAVKSKASAINEIII